MNYRYVTLVSYMQLKASWNSMAQDSAALDVCQTAPAAILALKTGPQNVEHQQAVCQGFQWATSAETSRTTSRRIKCQLCSKRP